MDESTSEALDAIAREPEDLDGHTIEELADYLDAGRTPVDPSIESSAACRLALAALERLRSMAPALLVDDHDLDEDAWVARVLDGIALDAHAGADFTLGDGGEDTRLVMTEGALRALVRAAGDDEPGFLIGRVRFSGDLDDASALQTIAIGVTVVHGVRIPTAVEGLRARIADAVRRHTPLALLQIDITVEDLEAPRAVGGAA